MGEVDFEFGAHARFRPIADIRRVSDSPGMKWPWSKEARDGWPELPVFGFVAGRAATVADVDAGEAVFCQQSDDDSLPKPWPVQVPQYALWRDANGSLFPAVLVQAEAHIHEPNAEPLFGLRRPDGSAIVATAPEVELLGTTPRR